MKSITIRLNDAVYNMIKPATEGQKRNISNFVEFATIQYLTSSQFIDDKKLVKNLMNSLTDLKNTDYTIVL